MNKLVLTLLILLVTPIFLNAQTNAKLHLILVANTTDANPERDENIKYQGRVSTQKIIEEVRVIKRYTGMDYKIYDFRGRNFNYSSLVNFLKSESMSVSSKDVIIFYYAGHGFRSSTVGASCVYPAIYVGQQHMANGEELQDSYDKYAIVSCEVKDYLKKYNPRLLIMTYETCNNNAGDVPIKTIKNPYRIKAGMAGLKIARNYKYLFLKAQGEIDIAAAEKGTSALFNKAVGGFMTNELIKSIHKSVSLKSMPSNAWNKILWKTYSVLKSRTKGIPELGDQPFQKMYADEQVTYY